MASPPRNILEGARDDAYRQAINMWDHPRRVLQPDLSNVRQVFHIDGDPNVYTVPRTRILRGLQRVGIITGTNFFPSRFIDEIVNRGEAFKNANGDDDLTSDESFVWLTYRYLHTPVHGKRSAHSVTTPGGDVLEFPLNDVYDLPSMLFLYILDVVSQIPRGGQYHSLYCIDPIDDIREEEKIIDNFKKNRETGAIPLKDIVKIYNTIMSAIYTSIHGYDHIAERSTWNGSDESGTRIIVRLRNGQRVRIRIKLVLRQGIAGIPGGKWDEEMQAFLDKLFPNRCYLTSKNEKDSLCMLYCIMLGVMTHQKKLWMTREGKAIAAESISCRALYDSDSHAMQVLAKDIIEGRDPLAACGVECGKEYSIKELQEKLREVEEKVLYDDLERYALDVYVLEFGILKHVYPVYMSKRVEPVCRLPIICVQNEKGRGHYILATDMDEIMACSGGKIFYNCSKCGAAFYSKTALTRHVHYADKDSAESMHWSRSDISDDAEVKGECWRCMLRFPTEFEAAYHAEHCFMRNKTGYRFVRCIETDTTELPTLCGVKVNLQKEEEKNEEAYLLFADFESTIDEESGEHHIMSWGLYDSKIKVYRWGYELGEFMEHIYEVACGRPKTHVYFHNAMNYDGNFILRYVLSHEWTAKWKVKPIMKSSSRMQKLAFQIIDPDGHSHILDIGDTFLFLTMSLDRIVSSIRKPDLETNMTNFSIFFQNFRAAYPWVTDGDIDMILHKNLFPYKYFNVKEKLDTPIDEFRRIFSGENEEDLKYFSENVTKEHLVRQYPTVDYIMDRYRCRTARDYHDIYLMCDVLQLADVFTRAIHTLWESHHVFLPNYIGMPAASWAAFLRHDATMKIPLYSSTIYAEFFSSMTRGGVTSAPLRYAKSDETHSIIYLDVNGLYPYVMQQYKYPTGYFMWVTFDSLPDDVNCNEYLLNDIFPALYRSGEGMALTVDLHYTEEIKRMTDDFPFAPEHRVIYDEYFDDNGELRGFLESWSKSNNGEKMHAFTGLVGTLYDKTQYTVHWRLLEWYIRHGLIVTKIWWGVRFQEGDYLAGYVRKNIEIRNTRKDELGKMVYKLMGNSIYGKTFESPFKRGSYSIVRDETMLAGLLEEGGVSSITPIDELGWVVKMDGDEIVLDKPTYIGACVCEYAKMHMYELFYDKLRGLFEDVRLVYTDTDSVIVYITHPPEMHDPKVLFGYIKGRMPDLIGGIGGQVKSEIKDSNGDDDIIDEVIALRSKVYAYKTRDGHVGKRAKGTTHAAQEGQLDWEVYEQALKSMVSKTTINVQFIRNRFDVFTKDVERQSLSANDGKREICVDGIHTHAWGYS